MSLRQPPGPEVVCVLDARALLGEGPLWDADSERLWWVDIKRREVHRFDPASGRDERWAAPAEVGSLALRAAGGVVVALAAGFFRFDPETGRAMSLALVEADRPANRLNDGKPDRQGRFWAGSMDESETEPSGALYRLDADGRCQKLVDGIICANALCWSPDSRTLYFGDSLQQTVWAWDFEAESGRMRNRRVFLELPKEAGSPDGATVDAEGCFWLAQWGAWRVCRYDPAGRLMTTVHLPVAQPTCPAFGGADLDVVYVTSASIGLGAGARGVQPQAGGLFAFQPGVKGVAEARFAG